MKKIISLIVLIIVSQFVFAQKTEKKITIDTKDHEYGSHSSTVLIEQNGVYHSEYFIRQELPSDRLVFLFNHCKLYRKFLWRMGTKKIRYKMSITQQEIDSIFALRNRKEITWSELGLLPDSLYTEIPKLGHNGVRRSYKNIKIDTLRLINAIKKMDSQYALKFNLLDSIYKKDEYYYNQYLDGGDFHTNFKTFNNKTITNEVFFSITDFSDCTGGILHYRFDNSVDKFKDWLILYQIYRHLPNDFLCKKDKYSKRDMKRILLSILIETTYNNP